MEPLHFLKSFQKKHARARREAPRAFTLIEMLVVLGIIAVIMAIILTSQTTFNRTLLLTDTAYTVALSVRETQSLGLSSEKFLGVQNAAFGVDLSASTPGSYVQFADISSTRATPTWCPTSPSGTPANLLKPGNCVYDGATELFHTFGFNQGFVDSFCAYASGVSVGCSNSGSPALQSLDIVFQRPDTNTIITGTLTSGAYTSSQPDTACIMVTAPTGAYQYVKVTQFGQVSVTQSCP